MIRHAAGTGRILHRGLMTAESKGRFFNLYIRDRFPLVRLQRVYF